MPYHKFPPKNYYLDEFPLHHEFSYNFKLAAENAALDTTICMLARNTAAISVAADAVEANPKHVSFAEETGAACQPGSIIPRMSLGFTANIPGVARTNQWVGAAHADAIEELIFNWMPIYNSFPEPLGSINEEDGLTLGAVLELTTATGESVRPIFTGTDLINAVADQHPVSTVNDAEAFADVGLSVDLKMEAVAFDPDIMFDTLKYGTNQAMLKKIIGKWNTVKLVGGNSYHFQSNNYMFPSVKRMNSNTFCGILFHCPQAGSTRQVLEIGDTTATTAQLQIRLNCNYDEWNPNFDQTSA